MSTKVFSPTSQVFPRKKLYFYPDQTGLAAATALAAVGEELRVGHGAEVQAEDMAGQEPGVFQLAAGKAPEVQGAAGRVKPGGVVWAPFLREVGKLGFVRPRLGPRTASTSRGSRPYCWQKRRAPLVGKAQRLPRQPACRAAT